MKKLLSYIALSLCCAASLVAQPTLTAATNTPMVGDRMYFHYCDTTSVTTGVSGPAVTWNFATLNQNVIDTVAYITCASTPYCDSFPGSTIASTDLHSNYYYYKTSASAFTYMGYATPSTTDKYTDLNDFLYFPLTYNSAHTDTALSPLGGTSYYSYIDSFKCDAYGTLILPSGTYNNVLRVHETQYGTQYITGIYTHTRYDYYSWYIADTHAPVLSLIYDTSGGGGTSKIRYVYYTTRLTTGVVDINNSLVFIKLSPNPANELLTIDITDNITADYTINNTIGSRVLQGTISGAGNKIDISGLPTGIYYINVIQGGYSVVKKFVKL